MPGHQHIVQMQRLLALDMHNLLMHRWEEEVRPFSQRILKGRPETYPVIKLDQVKTSRLITVIEVKTLLITV